MSCFHNYNWTKYDGKNCFYMDISFYLVYNFLMI
jgi:hypothetical protein